MTGNGKAVAAVMRSVVHHVNGRKTHAKHNDKPQHRSQKSIKFAVGRDPDCGLSDRSVFVVDGMHAHERYPLLGMGTYERLSTAGTRPWQANCDPARIALRHTNPFSIIAGRSPNSRPGNTECLRASRLPGTISPGGSWPAPDRRPRRPSAVRHSVMKVSGPNRLTFRGQRQN